jgi:hypothetical protein
MCTYIYIYIYARVCVCVCVDISLTVFSYCGIWLQVEWSSFETYGTACLYVIVIRYITWNKNVVVYFSLCVSTLLFIKVMLKHNKVLKYNSSQNICVCSNSLRSVLLNLNLSYMIYLTKHITENNLCYALWYLCCWLAMLAVELQLLLFIAAKQALGGVRSLAVPILDLRVRRGG